MQTITDHSGGSGSGGGSGSSDTTGGASNSGSSYSYNEFDKFGTAFAYQSLAGLPADWRDLKNEQSPFIFNGGWENKITDPEGLRPGVGAGIDATQKLIEDTDQAARANAEVSSNMQREHEEEQRRKEEEERRQQQSQHQSSMPSYWDHLQLAAADAFSWDSYKKRGAGMFGALKDTVVGLGKLSYSTSLLGTAHRTYNLATDPQGELEKMQALSDGISDGINGLIQDPMKIVRALDRMSMDPDGQGRIGTEILLFLLPAPKGLSLMKGGRFAARSEAAVANNLDEVGKVASKLDDAPREALSFTNEATRASSRIGVNHLKTAKLRREIGSSALGRQVLSAADDGVIELTINATRHHLDLVRLQNAPIPKTLLGRSYENVAEVFLLRTQGYQQTASTAVHEGMHALGVRGSRQAEILARLGELHHAGKEIGFSDIWRVSREVRKMKDAKGRLIYGHLPKRTGGTTEHFPGLRF